MSETATEEKEITREHIAYHEAGHAAVVHHFGWEVWECTVFPQATDEDGRSIGYEENQELGRTRFDNPCYPPKMGCQLDARNKKNIERAGTVCYAGLAAEVLYDPACKESAETWAGGDFQDASDLFRGRFGSDLDGWDRTEIRCMNRAHRLVADPAIWKNIQRIAQALLEKGTLNQEEFERVISPSFEVIYHPISGVEQRL